MKNTSSPARRGLVYKMVLAPYSLWALLFILVPLIFVAYYAFTDQNFNFTFDNITRFFTATSTVSDGEATKEIHTYLVIFARSLKLAVISTVICLIMGYPMAYIISRSSQRTQNILITLIMIPMWMNFLIRTYAWMTILQDTGILNGLLARIGLGQVHIIGTEAAVIIGMVELYHGPFGVWGTVFYGTKGIVAVNRGKIAVWVGTGAVKPTPEIRKQIAEMTFMKDKVIAESVGKDFIERFMADLARLRPDLLIVSGLAYGVDICAHRAALKNGLETLAVLAHGLDRVYPSLHRHNS